MKLTRTVLPIASVALLLLTACTGSGGTAGGASSSSSSSERSSVAAQEQASVSSASSDAAVDTSARIIDITAKNWEFVPAAITVRKGEKVTLKIAATQGNHGFMISDLNINVSVNEGQTVDVGLPTDTAGTFSFRCSVPCGEGHRDMTGTITVQ